MVLTSKKLKGNWGTLLLPILPNEKINWQLLKDDIDYLISAKLDGIYSNGTAGEFHNQTEHEFDRIQQYLSEKCLAAHMPFQIGAAHPSPVISLERVKRCTALKPDAFQVILPDWVRTNHKEQIFFLQKIAEAAEGIPLVLYNPPHAKTVLSPLDFYSLKDAIPSLIGIKVASGDDQWYSDMRKIAHSLSVFVPGHLLATGIKENVASGSYSNVACLNPEKAQWWWQLMQSNLEEALEVQSRILTFMNDFIIPFRDVGYSNPALDKMLAAVGGWSHAGTRLRWPYQWIDASEVAQLRSFARKIIPEFII